MRAEQEECEWIRRKLVTIDKSKQQAETLYCAFDKFNQQKNSSQI